MKSKAASGIMLTLLLAGILTSAFNIQPAKAGGSIDSIRSVAFISLMISPVFAVVGFWNVVKQKQIDLVMRLKELKEQLGRGAITQEEYEHLLFALFNLSTEIISEEEYEQRKNKLLEKSET